MINVKNLLYKFILESKCVKIKSLQLSIEIRAIKTNLFVLVIFQKKSYKNQIKQKFVLFCCCVFPRYLRFLRVFSLKK